MYFDVLKDILHLLEHLVPVCRRTHQKKIKLNDGIRWGEENKKRLMLSSMNINDEL